MWGVNIMWFSLQTDRERGGEGRGACRPGTNSHACNCVCNGARAKPFYSTANPANHSHPPSTTWTTTVRGPEDLYAGCSTGCLYSQGSTLSATTTSPPAAPSSGSVTRHGLSRGPQRYASGAPPAPAPQKRVLPSRAADTPTRV